MVTLQINRSFLALIAVGVTSLSISLFRFLQAIKAYNGMTNVLISSLIICTQVSFIFFGNHIGQQITNGNTEIFDTVYEIQWYVVSQNIQKLVLFLLQKGNKNYYLSIGGVYNSSYEGFTTMMTSAISYFTVIYNFQE